MEIVQEYHFVGSNKMILDVSDNCSFLIAREVKSTAIGAWINT